MAYKLNKCTDNEITLILDSDSGPEQADRNTLSKSQGKTNTKIKNTTKTKLDISSDAENIFQVNKYALPKSNLQMGKMKVKLKKSAELSLYSIDTDSDYEKPIRKRRNRLERQRKKSHSEVESEGSYTDSKDNSMNAESVNKNDENADEKPIKNDLLRSSRNRRPPSKLSYYQCETISPSSPSLRTRQSVNYNEDRLFIKSIVTNIKNKDQQTRQKENKVVNSNKQNLESIQSTVKESKLVVSKKNTKTDNDTSSKVVNTESLKRSDELDVTSNDKFDLLKKVKEKANEESLTPVSTVTSVNIRTKKIQEVTKEDSVISTPAVTPVKSIRQKRIISESTQRNVQQPDNTGNNTEDESLADVYKRIKVSSAVNSSTPVKRNIRKNSEHRQIIGNTNNSDDEKKSLVDTCKDIKVLSTPGRSSRRKMKIEYRQIADDINNSDEERESLVDTCKNTKILSTPGRSSRRKMKIEYRQVADDTNNSDDERESLADMCKNIKISSPKKRILTPKKGSDSQKSIELHLEEIHLSTPKSRSVKCSTLTPSLGKRKSTLLKPATPLQEARSRLHVSAVPKSLPCREEEFNNIFTFLRGKLEDKSGGCMYISGVPGTGKTATVNEAVRCLQKLIMKGELADFDYVAINGMKLTEPRQAYVQILKQLGGKATTWEQAYGILEKRFHRANSKMTLLLVDELDFLCTKRQDVVYNLLDWPAKSTAQLVVITIANTMDLPERVLMGRVTSRLGLTRLTFQPYNYKQLQEIVMSRLKDFRGFRAEAVQLAARKVSAVSGDARRALDICRRAMEIAESQNAETISLQDVTQAVSEMIASAKVQAIKHCSKMEQIFLQAMSAEVTRTSIEEAYFIDIYKQLESLCSFDGIEVPTVTEVLAVCGRLGANRLLICEHSRNDIYQKILLNVSPDDIHYAVQELDFNS